MEAPGVAPQALSESGSWLCEKHPILAKLCKQIDAWEDGVPRGSSDVEQIAGPVMWKVRDTVIEFDRIAAKATVTREVGAIFRPRHEGVGAMLVMSPSEVGRLRLLATLAPLKGEGPGVQFCVADLQPFDAAGKELIQDWLRAVRIGILG